jgi:hypothetical protein
MTLEKELNMDKLMIEAQRIEIAALKDQIAALSWKPITPDSLPNVGDEVYSSGYKSVFFPDSQGTVYAPERTDDLRPHLGWINAPSHAFTHYRPINPPTTQAATEGQ